MTKREGLDGDGLTHTNTHTVMSNWYEDSLPLQERKRRGHFSTPPPLVERILDACGYTSENDLARLRVLDPACGSGNFLAGAARRLIAFAACQGLSRDGLLALASRNLWGFDPDPVSCFLAEMQVKTVLDEWAENMSPAGAMNRAPTVETDALNRNPVMGAGAMNRAPTFPTVGARFIAPAGVGMGDEQHTDDAFPAGSFALHIHQADGLALPWQDYEGVDLFLANPPYLAAKNTDLSGYRSTHRQGQQDSYLLFLDVALSVVRPGGWLGLVLPDPVLARANAAGVRARLLQTCALHHLWHLSDVFSAHVGAVVLIAQKCPAHAAHLVSWQRAHWHHVGARFIAPAGQTETSANTVPQSLFQRQPGAELRYLLSREQGSLIERLREQVECASGNGEEGHLVGEEGRRQTDAPTNHEAAPFVVRRGVSLPAPFFPDNTNTSKRRLAPLGDFLTIRRGEELGRKSPLLVRDMPSLTPGHPDPTPEHSNPTPGHPQGVALLYTESRAPAVYSRATPCGCPGGDGNGCPVSHFPVLLGGVDLKPYGSPVGSCWIAREAIEKPLERYLGPKLLVVKSTDRLQAALDVHGHVVLQTLYVLHLRTNNRAGGEMESDDLYFFLALLNSRLLREYVYVLHTAYKWVQPQMEQHVLARLPVPLVAQEARQEIVERAKLLAQVCSEAGAVVELKQQWEGLYEEQERAIRALYTSAIKSDTNP